MLLDELLDERLLEHEPDWPSWSIAVRQQLTEANGDHERQMNLLRMRITHSVPAAGG